MTPEEERLWLIGSAAGSLGVAYTAINDAFVRIASLQEGTTNLQSALIDVRNTQDWLRGLLDG